MYIYIFTRLFLYESCDRIEPPYLFGMLTFSKLAPCSGPGLARSKSPTEPRLKESLVGEGGLTRFNTGQSEQITSEFIII